jgi:hypothetical protein
VSISGTPTVGQQLTGLYTFNDVDGDAEGTSTFRWLRNDTAISGATASSYTLTVAEEAAVIAFEVTPVSATGTPTVGDPVTSAVTVAVSPKPGTAPTATDVTIAGGTYAGDTLTGSYVFEDADGDAEGTTTFRWLKDGVPIDDATAITYVTVTGDAGATITFEVTPVSATGAPNEGTPVLSNGAGPIQLPTSIVDRFTRNHTPVIVEIEAISLRGQKILRTIETNGIPAHWAAQKQAQLFGLPAGVYFVRAKVKNRPVPAAADPARRMRIVVW